MIIADFTLGDALLTVLEIFLLVVWFWILIAILGDLFRDHELSGWWKAVWVFFLIFVPFLTALHNLVSDDYSTASQVAGVLVFNLIQWSPVLVPFALLEFRPEPTERALRRLMGGLTRNARKVAAGLAFAVGAYATISGLARLLS